MSWYWILYKGAWQEADLVFFTINVCLPGSSSGLVRHCVRSWGTTMPWTHGRLLTNQLFYEFFSLNIRERVVNLSGCSLKQVMNYNRRKNRIKFLILGISMCGTNHGSSDLIYQMVMMDGRRTMPHPKRQVKVFKGFCYHSRPRSVWEHFCNLTYTLLLLWRGVHQYLHWTCQWI